MMKLIFLILLVYCPAHASDVSDAFAAKNFSRISDIYRENPKRNFSPKELIMISYSMRKLGFYRQDIRLSVRLINQKYQTQHRRLLKQISDGDTVDAEEYPEALKVLYWNLMNDYGMILMSYQSASELIQKDQQHYTIFSKILSELEFREAKVDRYNDKIVAHVTLLENKVYRFSRSLSFQYLSWQTESSLAGNGGKTGLVITNRGICVGGDAGVENAFYHFYVDGCLLAGSGGVSSTANSSNTTYQQSNVGAFGAKFGPGASMIVSSSGSRIGVRLPVIYTIQHLQEPNNNSYSIKQIDPVSFVASVYSRWQFQTWYFQTEFGKYIQQEQTYWGIGLGKRF